MQIIPADYTWGVLRPQLYQAIWAIYPCFFFEHSGHLSLRLPSAFPLRRFARCPVGALALAPPSLAFRLIERYCVVNLQPDVSALDRG